MCFERPRIEYGTVELGVMENLHCGSFGGGHEAGAQLSVNRYAYVIQLQLVT